MFVMISRTGKYKVCSKKFRDTLTFTLEYVSLVPHITINESNKEKNKFSRWLQFDWKDQPGKAGLIHHSRNFIKDYTYKTHIRQSD
jgi:hypothetical protein